MKILHTITDMNLTSGGSASSTINLFEALTKLGIDIEMFSLRPRTIGDICLGEIFKNIIKMPYDGITPFVYSKNFKNYLEYNHNYDIYHANGLWTYPTHKTINIAKKFNKPSIVTIHGMLNRNALKMGKLKKELALNIFQKKDLGKVSFIHSTSKYEVECIRELGINTPIALIPNGITMTPRIEEKPNDGICRFGFVGRIDRVKNIDILLEAWNNLGIKTKNCELSIIGGGYDDKYIIELTKFIKENKLNVRFTGMLSKQNTLIEMSKLDYLILPSRSENFGMVIPEALSMGIPCIATKGTPWEELNTHNCGWWIDGDKRSIADAIQCAITTTDEDYKLMGNNGINLVENKYAIEKTAEMVHKLYKYTINGGKQPQFII